MTFTAREGTVVAAAAEDPRNGRKALQPRVVNLSGDVRLDGSAFADGTSHAVSGNALAWELEPHGDYTFDLARLSSPEGSIELRSGPTVLRARRLTLDRSAGTALFEERVEARLAARRDRTGSPMDLACDRLSTNLAAKGIRDLEAVGRVFLGGLAGREGAPPGRAEADRFTWDVVEERGLLEVRPFVRVRQGDSLITAPRVVLESPTLVVLKGPKQVRLVQEGEEYRAGCAADLVLDQASGLLRMRDDCRLRTGDLEMRADRIDAVLGGGGRGLESLTARGDLRLRRIKDGTNLYGSKLVFRPSDQSFTLFGSPYAVADTGRTLLVQERIQVYEKVNGGGQKVRYTEMTGGRDGLRIVIDEHRP
jgi:hypothetical protein